MDLVQSIVIIRAREVPDLSARRVHRRRQCGQRRAFRHAIVNVLTQEG